MEYTEARKLTVYICDDDKLGRKPLSRCSKDTSILKVL
jgi:hypothetical protein